VIYDFITCLLSEENIITLGAILSYGYIRRLSLDCNREHHDEISTAWLFSRVRSIAVFGNSAKQVPDLSAFKLVRVLDLEDTEISRHRQLKSIGSMLLLRYLGLRGTGVTKLPKQIMALQHLGTLDIRRTMVTRFTTGNG